MLFYHVTASSLPKFFCSYHVTASSPPSVCTKVGAVTESHIYRYEHEVLLRTQYSITHTTTMRETSNATAYGTVENERFLFLDIPGCNLLGLYVHRETHSLVCSFSKPKKGDDLRTVNKTLEIHADIRGDCDWEYLYLGSESHFYVRIAGDNGVFCYLYSSEENTFRKIRQYQYNSAKRWYFESHMPCSDEKYSSRTRDVSSGAEYMFIGRSQPERPRPILRRDRMIGEV